MGTEQVLLIVAEVDCRRMSEAPIPVQIRITELLAEGQIHLPTRTTAPQSLRRITSWKDERHPRGEGWTSIALHRCLPSVVDHQISDARDTIDCKRGERE